MDLGQLIAVAGIDAKDVVVMFHVSDNPTLHRALPMLADERPDLFDAFQNQHGPQAEAVLKKRRFLLSFVNTKGADYVFAGLFENHGSQARSMVEFDAAPLRIELQLVFGDVTFAARGQEKGQPGRLEFDLRPRLEMTDLIGRLHVFKPTGRAYARLAENLDCAIAEITRERHLSPPSPDWRDFVVDSAALHALPRDWAARLREWRGVYLIVDQKDGARYVGSAYSVENLLARWRTHVAGTVGVTAELADRDPGTFRFSILERVSPDLAAEAVIAIEQNWKWRLDTVHPHGLNRN